MSKPDHPHEVRLQMALDAALQRSGEERDAFLEWLRAADPQLAAHVLLALHQAEKQAGRDGHA